MAPTNGNLRVNSLVCALLPVVMSLKQGRIEESQSSHVPDYFLSSIRTCVGKMSRYSAHRVFAFVYPWQHEILRVWLLDQYRHYLGKCYKCKSLIPTPDPPNQKLWL